MTRAVEVGASALALTQAVGALALTQAVVMWESAVEVMSPPAPLEVTYLLGW